ncbi:MAG: butyrate kinase [Synergistaceae bacterium]|nr:butyrate kinase [Synergistaceae bacterium]
MKIFAINPGSTGTKVALYDGLDLVWSESSEYSHEDIEHCKESEIIEENFRFLNSIEMLEKHGNKISELSAVAGRGGLLRPMTGGAWFINEAMLSDLRTCRYGRHASNFGGIIAKRISDEAGYIPAFIVDPVCVDEMSAIAHVSGIPDLPRRSIFHALNQKAVAYRVAKQMGKHSDECRFIVVHMGGGVTVGAHCEGRVIDVNNGLGGYGPMSLERAGTVHAGDLIKRCFSGEYSEKEIMRTIIGNAGVAAHLGARDFRKIAQMVHAGDEKAKLVVEAMAYQIAAEIGARAVNLYGCVDAVILTGGLANSVYLCDLIKERVSWISEVVCVPGEDELKALAEGTYKVLTGEEEAHVYEREN